MEMVSQPFPSIEGTTPGSWCTHCVLGEHNRFASLDHDEARLCIWWKSRYETCDRMENVAHGTGSAGPSQSCATMTRRPLKPSYLESPI